MKLFVRNDPACFVELRTDRSKVVAVLIPEQRLLIDREPGRTGLPRRRSEEHVVNQQDAVAPFEEMQRLDLFDDGALRVAAAV